MKLKTARNATSTAYEYFLYGILVLETAIAVFAFKTIAQISQLSVASTGYLLLLYAGVLGWVFLQLNRLHSKRKVNTAVASPGVALPDPENPVPATQGLALQAPALETVAVQAVAIQTPAQDTPMFENVGFAEAADTEAKPIDPDFDPPAVQAKSRLPLGLTGAQLAIVFVVFVAAVKLFTWALPALVKP